MTKTDEGAAFFRTRVGRDALTLAIMFNAKGKGSPETNTAYTDVLSIAGLPDVAAIYENDIQGAFVALAEVRLRKAMHGTDPNALFDALSSDLSSMRQSIMVVKMLGTRVPDIRMFADTLPEDATTCLLTWIDGDTINSAGVIYAAETGDFFQPGAPEHRMRVLPNSDGSVAVLNVRDGTTFPGMLRKLADPEPRPEPETDTTDPRP